MNTHDLSRELALFQEIRARIGTIYDMEPGDEFVTGTAIGETNIEETIGQVLREAKASEAAAKGIGKIVEQNRARQDRLEMKAERLRAIAVWALEEIGQRKLMLPDMTVSLRENKPKAIVVQEGSLAAEYIREVITRRPDMKAIQAAVDAGNVPDGVAIENGKPVLTVRLS